MSRKQHEHVGKHMKNKKRRIWPVVLAALLVSAAVLGAVYGPDAVDAVRARNSQSELRELYYGNADGAPAEADKTAASMAAPTTAPAIAAEPTHGAEETADAEGNTETDDTAETAGNANAESKTNGSDAANSEATEYAATEPEIVEPEATVPAVLHRHEDFDELYSQNEHTIGWLKLGERIDYPVVQYDDVFYLDHDFFGKEDNDGTLFLNSANIIQPVDEFLLIHGHNMKSGAMFGELEFYREYSYLCEYPIVTFRSIYDAEDVYYVPVAGFDASMEYDAEGYFDITHIRFDDFEESETPESEQVSAEMEAYIAELRAASYWISPVEADSTDDYLVLVTCSYDHEDGRFVLVCRRLRDGETPEGVTALFDKAE